MLNKKIALILYEIADILEIQGIEFKPIAYRRAAQTIESLSKDIKEAYKENKLEELPGIGKHIADKIKEIIETGSLRYYKDLKKKLPIDFEGLMNVEGIGPKKVKLLWKKLGIKNVKDLEKAIEKHKLAKLKGLGEKTEKNILEGIDFAKKSKGRMLLSEAMYIAESIIKKLKDVKKINYAGSIRRGKETIGDIDILCCSNNKNIMEEFVNLDIVKDVIAKGTTRSAIVTKDNVHVDLRLLDEKTYGAALLYFTGSKEHNIELRKIAINKKWKLSEYGLFKGDRLIAGKTEEEIYKKLGLGYIEPELRENNGEIEASRRNKLPNLVKLEDIKSDLQMHSDYSDGNNTIKEMAEKCIKLGYKYMLVTDHTGKLKIANSLDERRAENYFKEIDRLNKNFKNFRIFKGAEVDIKENGDIGISDKFLKKFDVIVASIHSAFKKSKEEQTKRLLKAMDNKYIKIIGHLTGRLINERKSIEVDIDKIFKKARENNIVLEINAFPNRLDLNDANVREAIKNGCKLSLGTDAHSAEQLDFMKFGVITAKRGWAEKKDIVNCYDVNKFKKFFNIRNV